MTSLRSRHESRVGEPHLSVVQWHSQAIPPQSPACFSMDLSRRASLISEALQNLRSQSMHLAKAADCIINSLLAGGRILVAGHGKSIASAQHFAAELIARFPGDRAPHAALALVALAHPPNTERNDLEHDETFPRQVAAYGRRGDVLVTFNTSSCPGNLVRAADVAAAMEMTVIAITGPFPTQLASTADVSIRVPNNDTQVVQEAHVVILHLLCESVERALIAALKESPLE